MDSKTWMGCWALILVVMGCQSPRTSPPTQVALPSAAVQLQSLRYRMTDCHLHLVDFLQRTDGINAALAAMDRCGVEDAVISGMPVVKEWPGEERLRPEYYLSDDSRCYWYSATDVLVARQVMSLPAEQRKRFHPTICGFNGADRNAIDHIKRMVDWYPDFWQGIGEVMTRHDDLTALTYGEPARADNLALDSVFKFAGEHDLPIFLHSDIGSVWQREPIYENEVETAVSTHPNTRFVWCHAGISRRIEIPTLTQELRRMLEKYPNLWVDISWVVYENDLIKAGTPDPDWVKLIEAFPDRFLIGTDKVGHFADYPQEVQKYYMFLDVLRPITASKIACENLWSVLPKSPARLSIEESDLLNGRTSPATELMK
jgi:hypothetical protein